MTSLRGQATHDFDGYKSWDVATCALRPKWTIELEDWAAPQMHSCTATPGECAGHPGEVLSVEVASDSLPSCQKHVPPEKHRVHLFQTRSVFYFRFTWERLGGEPSKYIGFIRDLPSRISGQTFLRATVPNKN